MILVDSSVWIDHLRRLDANLSALLAARVVMSHPFIAGELACGMLPKREKFLSSLAELPVGPVVAHDEVMEFVERHELFGRGLGWVDANLLASATVAGRVSLWSRDKRLTGVALGLGLAYQPAAH